MASPPTTTPWVPMWPLEAATPPDVEGIPADVVVPAANHLIANKYAAGDANHGYVLYADGKQVFGDGTAAVDVGLYRSAQYTLKVGPYLEVEQSLVVGSLVNAFINMPQDDARIWMGVNYDVNLYRSAPGILTTDGRMQAKDANVGFHAVTTGYGFMVNVAGDPQGRFAISYGGGLEWGEGAAARDTSLVRYYAAGLGTPGDFIAGGTLNAGGSRTPGGWALRLTAVGEPQARFFSDNTGHFDWGDGTNPTDTTLYRLGVGALKTANTFLADEEIIARDTGGALRATMGWQPGGYGGFSAGGDTYLYRINPGAWKTNGDFQASGLNYANVGTPNQVVMGYSAGLAPAIAFGAAADATIFRAAAGRILSGSVLGSQHGGHWSYLGAAYTGPNGYMGGYWAGSIYYDGANWINDTAGGNNGWAMWGVEGAGGGASFYSEPASGAVQRTYTPAEMQSKRLLRINEQGGIVFKDGTTQYSAAGATRPLVKVRRNANTSVGPGRIQWESSDTDNYGGWSSGYREAVFLAGVGVYKITVQGYFSGGSGDGDQGIWVSRLGTGAVLLEDIQVTWQHSANNGWNRWQCGTVTVTAVAGDALVARCDGGATGTPGNCQATCMTVEKIA